MEKRSPIAVFFLGLITLGLYSWYWAVKTKGEMNKLGEHIPTAWIWLIPIVGSLYWYWKYCEGVEHVTKKEMSGVLAFIILYFLFFIGQAIIQGSFNAVGAVAPAAAGSTPPAPTDSAAPAPPAETPPTAPPATPPVV